MNKKLIQCILALVVVAFASCSRENVLYKMERIKLIGNENPQRALKMLDSLEIEVRDRSSDYTMAKYDLLRIRLNDKANNIPNSDIEIKKLVIYFEREGTASEKQEVCYYAGSVYRDLQDTPQALEYFLKSLDYTNDNKDCDSIMLRNTYSNLHYLHYIVQNYNEAESMAQKELTIAKETHSPVIVPYMHIGASLMALDSLRQAKKCFNRALEQIVHSKEALQFQDAIIHLLCNFSELKEYSKARECISLVEDNPLKKFSAYSCLAFAQYYESFGKNDSAIVYSKRILDDGSDVYNMYDAAKLLYRIYNRTGDIHNASQYAGVYMQLSDSLDFGKRQELAATVNNEYKYHLDQKKEQNLKDEKEKYKHTLFIVSLAAVLLVSIGYILYIRRRNKHLQEVIVLSLELQRVSDDDKQLRANIVRKEQELAQSKKSLEVSSNELANVKRELERVNDELADSGEALKAKEQQLTEKMDQNKTFIKLLHQSELEGKAEDVIFTIKQSTTGKKNMKSTDWKQLYQAVDELYPLFKDRLLKELGTFTEQQMQVCYLIRIGLSKPQIRNMTNLSRVTIWRWVKKYEWILSPDDIRQHSVSE